MAETQRGEYLLLVIVLVQNSFSNGLKCETMQGSCACVTDQGLIDLSPLDSKDANNPRFLDVPDSSGGSDSFSYNPCSAFYEDGGCKNVAACQYQADGLYYPIGDQDSVVWVTVEVNGASRLQLQYSSTNSADGVTRTSAITLTCDMMEEGRLVAHGETSPGSALYSFELISRYACAGAVKTCRKVIGNCTCVTNDGVIDLSPLDARNPFQPRFHSITDTTGSSNLYSYNPCSPFNQGQGCSNVAVCLTRERFAAYYYYPLGNQSSITWSTNEVNGAAVRQIHYSSYSQVDKITRKSVVTLTCDLTQEGVLLAYGETFPDSAVYEFELLSAHACIGRSHAPTCEHVQGNCACVTDQGLIDLSPLDSHSSSSPRFKDVLGPDGAKYSYNPCTPFEEGNGCSNVALCQVVQYHNLSYPVGDHNTLKWSTVAINGSESLQLKYSSYTDIDRMTRTSTVILVCDLAIEGVLVAKGETSPGSLIYIFELRSRYACPMPSKNENNE